MYDAFLSYSRTDADAVVAIANALKQRDLTPFLDRWHLAAGQPWPELLEQHLDGCRAVVVFVGPSGLGKWQQRERSYALDRQANEPGFPVIPVLLPGVDDPALGFLQLNTWIEFRTGAADVDAVEALARAIRGEPPGEPGERVDPRAEICPYRGLRPFREEDASFFFGREGFTDTLVEKVRARRFVAVVGASGGGKSSVVRAGLVPALRERGGEFEWDVVTLLPGAEPLQALVRALDPPPPDLGRVEGRARVNAAAARLRAGDVTLAQLVRDTLDEEPGTDRLLLVVDQFEELYTLVPDDRADDRDRFTELLLDACAADGGAHVVITLRGDFFARALSRRDLADHLQDGVVNIGPLKASAGDDASMSELESVIRRPAELLGLRFEDGLVERILTDVGEEPGNLPLLEFLLTELWRQRERGTLAHATYDVLGGVQGAIAARAEEAYSSLKAADRVRARHLFLSLVRPGEGQEDTRARAAIPDDPAIEALVQFFSSPQARLLVTAEDAAMGRTVEVSHEALIRSWGSLREWVDESRVLLGIRDRVRTRMERWRAEGEPDDLLLPAGLELEEGRTLIASSSDVPVEDVRDYVERSIAREERRRRIKRRLTLGVQVTAVAFIALISYQTWQMSRALDERNAALGEALSAQQEAERQRKAALSAKDDAERMGRVALDAEAVARSNSARALAALSAARLREGRPEDATRLALAAWPGQNQPGRQFGVVLRNLGHAVAQLPAHLGAERAKRAVATLAPDGRRGAVHDRGEVRIHDLAGSTGSLPVEVAGDPHTLRFTADGSRLIVETKSGDVHVLVGDDGRHVLELPGTGTPDRWQMSFDGSRLAVAGVDGERIAVYDLSDGRRKMATDGATTGYALSPSGDRLVVSRGHGQRVAHVYEVATGEELSFFEYGQYRRHLEPTQFAFMEGTDVLFTRVPRGSRQAWNLRTGARFAAANDALDFDPVAQQYDLRMLEPAWPWILVVRDFGIEAVGIASDRSRVWPRMSPDAPSSFSSVSTDGELLCWNVRHEEGGARIVDLTRPERTAVGRVLHTRCPEQRFPRDGDRIYVRGEIHDLSKEVHAPLEMPASGLTFDAVEHALFVDDGRRLLARVGWARPRPGLLRTLSSETALWDSARGTLLASMPQVMPAPGASARPPHAQIAGTDRFVAVNPDASLAIGAAGVHGVLRVLDGPPLHLVTRVAGEFDAAVFDPDGNQLLLTLRSGIGVRMSTSDWSREPLFGQAEVAPWRQSRLSADGTAGVIELEGGRLQFFDPATGALRRRVDGNDAEHGHPAPSYELFENVVFAPGGRFAAVHAARAGGPVVVFALDSDARRVLDGAESGHANIAFTPDGTGLAVATERGVQRFDVTTGAAVDEVFEHSHQVRAIAYDAGGRRVATLDDSGTLRIHDRAGAVVATLLDVVPVSTSTSERPRIRFSPSGGYVAVASNRNGETVVLSLRGGKRIVAAAADDVAFHPNQPRIAVAGRDGARVFDLETGALLLHLEGVARAVAFSPDGRRLATARGDRAEVWDFSRYPEGNVLEVACALLPDVQTEDLAGEYGLDTRTGLCREPFAPPRVLASDASDD